MIEINSVSKRYGDKKIINDINMTINPGELTFIVGSSGAGKSTLLNLIGGLDTISFGSICYNDVDNMDNLTQYRSDHVGFVFQDYNLITGLSVKKNIELGLHYSHKKSRTIDRQIEYLGVRDENQSVETMSGGEKQRVAIIRSICKKSEIILADEPTGNLDSENAHIVLEMLTEIKKGKHIIVVTHDLGLAHEYGDRIITMKDGRILDDKRRFVLGNERAVYRRIVNAASGDSGQDRDCIQQKRRLINWKTVWVLGLNSIKMRFSKIVSVAFVVAITISALALIFDLNSYGASLSKNVNVNYLETDLIELYYSFSANSSYKDTPFRNTDIERIRNKYNAKEIVPIYIKRDGEWIFSNGNMSNAAAVKQINLDPFFEERVMSYDIDGNFLQRDNEIILASDVAEKLFQEQCIGKEVSLYTGMGEGISLKIVGINHTVNPFDQIYSFVSSEKIKELLEKELEAVLSERLILEKYSDRDPTGGFVRSGGTLGPVTEVKGTEEILYGDFPSKKDEIMISSALLPNALHDFEIQQTTSEDRIKGGGLPESITDELFSTKIVINHNGLYEVTISGVYQSDQNELRLPQGLLHEMKNNIEPTMLEVYLPETTKVMYVKEKINGEEEFDANTQLDGLRMNVGEQLSFFNLALLLIGVVTICLSVAMLGSFSKLAVLERKKEVATMKSLGAGNKDVMFTLWFDSLFISLLAYGFSCMLLAGFAAVFPIIVPEMAFMNYGFPLGLLTLIGGGSTMFICFHTWLGMRKLVKKMPAELFAQ
ncbi:MAG: ATP-binding cassette domain-containing protein [Peptococcaceae bacterium]|nr:ATP-binding cassette domain-containing protein [Peptococcaceae bacterium]